MSRFTKVTPVSHKLLSPLNDLPLYSLDPNYLPLCISSGRIYITTV